MSNYYYLDITLSLQEEREITPAFFLKNIRTAVLNLFGEAAASIDIDLLRFNPTTHSAIIRIPKSHYVKIRSSLTLGGYEGETSCFKINKASELLLSLQGDSRDYQH